MTFYDSLSEVFDQEGRIIVLKIVTLKVRLVESADCPETPSF